MCASLRLFKMSFIWRLKRQKMKVTKNFWNIKTETGQIARADKIWSFSKRFFPNFRCLSLTVKWLNAKRKCWSNGKSSDHSTRDSSSPFDSCHFLSMFAPRKGVGNPDSGIREILFVKSGILGFGIRNTGQEMHITLTIIIRNLRSPDIESGIQYLQSGIQSEESRIQDHLGLGDRFLPRQETRSNTWNWKS